MIYRGKPRLCSVNVKYLYINREVIKIAIKFVYIFAVS
jgi:hypothetical protein